MNVLVVGSSLFDVIIPLEESSHVKVEANRASFALGDKIPIDIKAFSIGGNAPNVASALKKLEIQSSFYTYLGNDPLSIFIKEKLTQEGIAVHHENTNSTNGPISLIFNFPTDRTIFSHHPEHDHGFDSTKLLGKPSHIFLTSIGKTWENAYEKVLEYARQENIPVALSPGSQQMKNMNETFVKTVHQATMLFCNMEEARAINQQLSGADISDAKELLLNIRNNGFELLSITDGANGAYAADKEGKIYKAQTLKPDGHEKTGAGDAYAGAFLAAYIQNNDIPTCMKYGVLNAMGVMSHVGAHTGQLTKQQMEEKVNQTELTVEVL